MINIIQNLLQAEEYKLEDHDHTITIFKGFFPEDCVEIVKNPSTGRYSVFEKHRDVRKFMLEAAREEACIWAVVTYKKLYDNTSDIMKVRCITEYMDSGEKEEALSYIINCFDDSIYFIGCEDKLKISLIQSEDKVDVKFAGEYLVEGVSLSRGYVAFYNYCEKLRHALLFFDMVQKKQEYIFNSKKALRWYMLGE